MNMMRLTTVQFAVPCDDPAFSISELRDLIQEQLYDAEGMAGSFSVIGTAEFDDPDASDEVGGQSRAVDWFENEATDLGAIQCNADNFLTIEAVEEAATHASDLKRLTQWAQTQAARGVLYMEKADEDDTATMRRLKAKGLLEMNGALLTLTSDGYAAIGWLEPA